MAKFHGHYDALIDEGGASPVPKPKKSINPLL